MRLPVRTPPASVRGAQRFWLRPASYLLPTHFPTSAWFTHAPFAAWLIDVMRPESVVELGTHYGFSCFAFAEAAERVASATTIHAIDTWEGDDHAGFYGDEVYSYVARTATEDFPASVHLIRAYFSEARGGFPLGSVDLLHIDGRHAYEDVKADFDDWRSTVRNGGIVLFHDIAERENGFGVWRLWEELSEPGRSFEFHHGHGLGVLAIGDVPDGPLGQLFTADASVADAIRADFAALGERVNRQVWLETLPAELEQVWAEVRHRASHEDQLEEALKAQGQRIRAIESSTSWRVTAPLRAAGRIVKRGA